MKMNNAEYLQYLKEKDPKSPWLKNAVYAFFSGGAICAAGQGLYQFFEHIKLDETDARAAVAMTLIFIAAVLTAFGLYDRLAKHAGAGTLIPITGFSNAIVSPAMEFKSEGLVTGMGARMFAVAGPVLVYGVAASVLYGLVLTIVAK
jgi:stage V sporulation protein AC